MRLRIQHDSDEEPNDLFCEVRVGPEGEFEVLGKVTSCVWDLYTTTDSYYDAEAAEEAA